MIRNPYIALLLLPEISYSYLRAYLNLLLVISNIKRFFLVESPPTGNKQKNDQDEDQG